MKFNWFFIFLFVFLFTGNFNLFGAVISRASQQSIKRVKDFSKEVGREYGKKQVFGKKRVKNSDIKNVVTNNNNARFEVQNLKVRSSDITKNINKKAQKTKNPKKLKEVAANIVSESSSEKEKLIRDFIDSNIKILDFFNSKIKGVDFLNAIEGYLQEKNIKDITEQEVYNMYSLLQLEKLGKKEKKADSKEKIKQKLTEETSDIASEEVIKDTVQNIIELKKTEQLWQDAQKEESSTRIIDTYNALENARKQSEEPISETTSSKETVKQEIGETKGEIIQESESKELSALPQNFLKNLINQQPTVESLEDAEIVNEIETAIENQEFTKEDFVANSLQEAINHQDPTALKMISTYSNTYVIENSIKTMDTFKEQFPEFDSLAKTDTSNMVTDESGNFELIKNDKDKTIIIHDTQIPLNELTPEKEKKLEEIIHLDFAQKQQTYEKNIETELLESPAKNIEIEEIIQEKTPKELEKEAKETQEYTEKFQEDAQKESKKKQLIQEKEISKKALDKTLKDFSNIDSLIEDIPSSEEKKITQESGKNISPKSSLPEPLEFPQTVKTSQSEISTLATKKPTELPETSSLVKTSADKQKISTKETGKNIVSESKVSPLEKPQTLKQPSTESMPLEKIVQQSIETSGTKKSQDRESTNKLSGAEKRETKELTGKFEETKKVESNLEKQFGTKISALENVPESSKQTSEIISKNIPSQKEIAEKNDAAFKKLKAENIITLKNLDDTGKIITIKTRQEVKDPYALKIVQDTTITLQKTIKNLCEQIDEFAENALQAGKEKTLSFENTFETTKDAIKNIEQEVTKKIDTIPNQNAQASLKNAVDIMIEQTNESVKNVENTTGDILLKMKGELTTNIAKKHLVEESKQLMGQANKVSRLLEDEIMAQEQSKQAEEKESKKEKKAGKEITEQKVEKTEQEKVEEEKSKKPLLGGILGLIGLVSTGTGKEEEEEAPLSKQEKENKEKKETLMREQQPGLIAILFSWLSSIINRIFGKKSEFDTLQDEIDHEDLYEETLEAGKERKTTKKNISKNKSSQETTSQDVTQPVYDITQPTYDEYQLTQEITPSVLQPVLDSTKKDTEEQYKKSKKIMDERLKNIEKKLATKIDTLMQNKIENNIPFGGTHLKDYKQNLGSKTEPLPAEFTPGRSEFSPSSFSPNYQPSYTEHDTSYDLFDTNRFSGFDNADFDFGTFDFLSDYDASDFKNDFNQGKKIEDKKIDLGESAHTQNSAKTPSEETLDKSVIQSKSNNEKEYVNQKEKAELLRQKKKEIKEEEVEEEKSVIQKKYYTPYVVPAIIFMAVSCAFLYYWFI